MIKDRDTFDGTTLPACEHAWGEPDMTLSRIASWCLGTLIGLGIGGPLGLLMFRTPETSYVVVQYVLAAVIGFGWGRFAPPAALWVLRRWGRQCSQ